jgi:hypothetical protein
MKFLNFILIILFSSTAFSQYSEDFIPEDNFETSKPTVESSFKKKVSTNIIVGSSIMGSGQNNYSFNTYINPNISYQLNPKFSISMGLMAIQSNFNNFTYYNRYENQIQSLNYSGTSMFYTLQGTYAWSENLKIYGGVMLGTGALDFAGAKIPNSTTSHQNPKAYRLGIEYKIGEHAAVQFEFQMREGSSMQNRQMQNPNSFGMTPNFGNFNSHIW